MTSNLDSQYDYILLPGDTIDEKEEIKLNTTYIDDVDSCGDFEECKSMQILVDLLTYYKRQQITLSKTDQQMIAFYKYISSLQYNISLFMDDWYHCKHYHFKTEK
eukprot:359217_1